MYGLESSVNLECKRLCKRLRRLDEKSVKKRFYQLSFPTQIGCCITFSLVIIPFLKYVLNVCFKKTVTIVFQKNY